MKKGREKKENSDIDYRVVDMRRVTRVVAGGRRFRFRATVIAGDRNGKVGVGVAKGKDTALAIEKALRSARKTFIMVPLTADRSIPHDITLKYGSSMLVLKPGKEGRGLVAGSAVRSVLELAGIENAIGKIISRSSNKLNNARATIAALSKLENQRKHAAAKS